MLIPSGILWNVIAIVRDNPNLKLFSVDKYVAIPSGILWSIIAIIDIIPTLYNSPSLSFMHLSIVIDKIIPITKKIDIIIIAGIILNVLFKYLIDSGIRSIIDIVIITPAANDSAFIVIFLVFINIGIVPNNVDSPANVVKMKAIMFI